MTDTAGQDVLQKLGMLASALSRRDLRVEHAKAGEPGWTDGSVLFVDSTSSPIEQLTTLCVQSALLSAGSLDPQILKQLQRRPRLAGRYLAIEAHRALSTIEAVLPPAICAQIDPALAARSESPSASLQLASGAIELEMPPRAFGSIRVRELLARMQGAGAIDPSRQHAPRTQGQEPLKELEDQAQQDFDDDNVASNPVGGGGGLGKLLKKLFHNVRSIKDGGSPGADAPTHWSRSGPRAGVRALPSTAQAESVEDAFGQGRGVLYPEWDVHRGAYRPDWCSVTEIAPPATGHANVEWLEGVGLRRPLSRLGLGLDRFHRRAQGDDIDIDAAIEAQLELLSGTAPHEAIYSESLRRRRDLSVLILLDVSGSVMQDSPAGRSVHEHQRSVAAELMTVLHEIGDRVSLYGFQSQGRSAVHLIPVKRFDEGLDSLVMRRLHSLIPGAYSRLGAAIRHGATLLIDHGGTARRLLLVLSDGLAYDHGYEPSYGRADARQALAEARRDGVGCLCLSVAANTDTAQLRQIFGSAAHANVPRAEQLGTLIGPLFRSALRSGEARRRIA